MEFPVLPLHDRTFLKKTKDHVEETLWHHMALCRLVLIKKVYCMNSIPFQRLPRAANCRLPPVGVFPQLAHVRANGCSVSQLLPLKGLARARAQLKFIQKQQELTRACPDILCNVSLK